MELKNEWDEASWRGGELKAEIKVQTKLLSPLFGGKCDCSTVLINPRMLSDIGGGKLRRREIAEEGAVFRRHCDGNFERGTSGVSRVNPGWTTRAGLRAKN